MENNPRDKFINSTPFPVSPEITEDTLKEIGAIEAEVLGPGVVVFRNAFSIDQDLVLGHIDASAAKAHEGRWDYITGEDGVEYGINEDGFRYSLEDIPTTPVRLLHPVTDQTPEGVANFFFHVEEQIYKCLLKYIDHYPLMIGSIWWKNRGHILRYGDGGILGCHADNDTNYKVTNGVRYMPRGMVASRQTCGALLYLNDCVDSEEELNGKNFTGGHLRFVHLGISYKPRKGDIIFFPTNFVASHDVEKMGKGVRYSYLSFFGQGGNDVPANVVISEPDKSFEWCPGVWFDNIYDDYERYCKSPYSMYFEPEKHGFEPGWNPVFQGRNVAQYSSTHEAIEVAEQSSQQQNQQQNQNQHQNQQQQQHTSLPEGPCGTDPVAI